MVTPAPNVAETAIDDPSLLLTTHVDDIRRIVRAVARRQRLSPTAGEELESAVWVHLIEDDYRVLRKFRGQSSLRTFLTVVISRLALDQRSAEWGRWRPSSQARQLGSAALLFETLVFRDAYSPDEAATELQARGYGQPSDSVRRLAERQRSTPRRYVPIEFVEERLLGTAQDPEAQLERRQQDSRASRARHTIDGAVRALPAADQVLLRMRYTDGLKVSTIARTLGLDQKALYRRLDTLHRRLRRIAERAGVVSSDAHEPLHDAREWTTERTAARCA